MNAPAVPNNEIVDWNIFGQILEMDEDTTERDFSRGIVQKFYEQAESTFSEMQDALDQGDLENLSRLGHFLKGSSASLGLINVQNICADIQHLGKGPSDSPASAEELQQLIVRVREAYNEIHERFEAFFSQ